MRAILAAIAFAAAASTLAAELNTLRLGGVALHFPDTWKFEGGGGHAEGHGPDGEYVIATYRLLRADVPPEAVEHHLSSIDGFARDEMPRLAQKNGKVVRPVTKHELAEGRVIYSAATQDSKLLRDYYFLQYLLGSKRALVYITVEGYGKVSDVAPGFDKTVESADWLE